MFYSQNNISVPRKNFMLGIVTAVFFIIFWRLYYIQIAEYSRFKGIAESNRIRIIPLEAPRGAILDRKGQIIVENKSQYNVNVIPYEANQSKETYETLTSLLNISQDELDRRIKRHSRGLFVPAKVADDVDFKTLTYLEEHRVDLPGVLYSTKPVRSFTSKANLSQVIGYLREINKQDLKNIKQFGYKQGDLIGWKGIEREYEPILRGTRGYNYIQVDVLGREVGTLMNREKVLPIPGNDLYLTIDLDLQIYAESLIGERRGSVVVMNALTGEILTYVSKPDYAPGLFSGTVKADVWRDLITNPDRPLYDRVIQGTYPPGSTFKIIAILSALENKTVDPGWSVYCNGKYRMGRRVYKCWKKEGHGLMNMHDAIVHSCNVYFYNLIRKIDIDVWSRTASNFGFGSKTDIDLYGESAGTLPDAKFLDKKYYGIGWTDGTKLNLVIGQGDLLVTPIQMVRFAGALATRGKIVQPHLGMKFLSRSNSQFSIFAVPSDTITSYSSETWEFIENAMFDVVESGTGRAAKVKDMKICGKTGTAQNPHGDDHAWFIGWSKPEQGAPLAIVVMIENGGSGGGIAAQIAGKIYHFYYNPSTQQMLADRHGNP
ncbi:MAG: penicillin-binding protein 2 [Candidatus Marinimicrobia bacterium CG08_land_8_20_14_0_20_45_22]|nr:MAG: penicillin-binding protein 2 [Candidatus Marinimicrobia bacterium CG08_land_8_20_14_0_20_45_22]